MMRMWRGPQLNEHKRQPCIDASHPFGVGSANATRSQSQLEVAVLQNLADSVEKAVGMHAVDDSVVISESHVHDGMDRH